jgi:dGTPase
MLAAVQLEEALDHLKQNRFWLDTFDSTPRSLAQLKNLTSDLIGSFVSRTTDSILENSSKNSLTRFNAGVIIPSKVKSEIAVLKGLVAYFLMTKPDRQGYYEDQRGLLIELADALLDSGPQHLDAISLEAWNQSISDFAKKRVIVDRVASLTDPGAIELHQSLVAGK